MPNLEKLDFSFAVIVAGPEVLEQHDALDLRNFLKKMSGAGVPCAYVASEPREAMEAHLQPAQLNGSLPIRVSLEEVGQGFPAPDLFVAAARQLGIECWRCIVVSLSPDALTAARRAACQTLAIGEEPEAETDAAAEDTESVENPGATEVDAPDADTDDEADAEDEADDEAEIEEDAIFDMSKEALASGKKTPENKLAEEDDFDSDWGDEESPEPATQAAIHSSGSPKSPTSPGKPQTPNLKFQTPGLDPRPSAFDLRPFSPRRLRTLFFSPSKTLYADIAVDLPVRRFYTYRIPQGIRSEARVGAMVRIPVRGRITNGVIARLSLTTTAPKKKLKSISHVLTPEYAISDDLMALGQWMSEYYIGGPGETLGAISFFGLQDEKPRTERVLALDDIAKWENVSLNSPEALTAAGLPLLTARQQQVVRYLIETLNEPITRADLTRKEGCSSAVIAALIEKKVLVEAVATVERDDAYNKPVANAEPHFLNPEQQSAYERILAAINAHRFEPFLLYGITGSGKTEIYLQTIVRVLELDRQAIVLVPEISLTPQAVERFRSRFGGRVGVYHSQLSRGQKYDLWRRIERGDVRVLIGARSALFAPFANLGLIVVDEEHEHSYKQSDYTPRYHARDVAIWRARFARIPVVLGSATPALESYLNAQQGRYTLLQLNERVGQAQLPDLRLVDMGAQVRDAREVGAISLPLRSAITERIKKGEQVILFLNRRGFSNFLLCMVCKATMRCDHCDMVMTWHKTINKMMCHICGDTKPRPEVCPSCGAPDPHPMGFGTQRIEEEVRDLFPEARLIRIDFDTTRGKHGFLRMWEEIEKGKADILLGTQMIAKGLHLENVTLVGVISADNSLFLPDFRAAERTFSQLTQVAGRAGRMSRHGEVVIQTFVPHYYAIQRAVAQDAEGFYKQELHMRDVLQFPPYWRLLLTRVTGEKPERVIRQAHVFGKILRDKIARNDGYRDLSILGPAPSPIGRIQDKTRWQLLIRGQKPTLMRRLLDDGLADYQTDQHRRGVTLTFDMDPMDLL